MNSSISSGSESGNQKTSHSLSKVTQGSVPKSVSETQKPVAIIMSQHGLITVYDYQGMTYATVQGFLTDEGRKVLDALCGLDVLVAELSLCDRPQDYVEYGLPSELVREHHVRLA